MVDSTEPKETFKFTQLLRSKQKEQREGIAMCNQSRMTYKEELREIVKRNVMIKKSYENEKKGFGIIAYLYEEEVILMKCLRQSNHQSYSSLYKDLSIKISKLEKPPQFSLDFILARFYKLLLFKFGMIESDRRFDQDYLEFDKSITAKLDPQKLSDLKTVILSIFTHKQAILNSEQTSDFYQNTGYSYNQQTFDDLYVKSFNQYLESITIFSTESSDENQEENKILENVNEQIVSNNKPQITKQDFIPYEEQKLESQDEQIEEPKKNIDRDLFNIDDDDQQDQQENNNELILQEVVFQEKVKANENENQDVYKDVDPNKVNWFKFIIDRYLILEDDKGNPSDLCNNIDIYANILSNLTSNKSDEEIQGELLDLVGYHNFILLEQLISKRVYIKEHCKNVHEKLQQEVSEKQAYIGKNMNVHSSINVTVQFNEKKKGKKGGKGIQQTIEKVSNYDLLRRLGFDRDVMEANKKAGIIEKRAQDLKFNDYVSQFQDEKRGNIGGNQIFEKPEQKINYTIKEEETDDYKFVQIVPPPKAQIPKKELIPILALPKYAQGAFKESQYLNQIQSKVFPEAFKSNRSLLVSAPTGAGKTNIALLTILREASQHLTEDEQKKEQLDMSQKQFKIIYIAPLKALASEIVSKFQKALGYLNIKVRELTGDMSLTKTEIHETHIIVSTPEKWDVVSRKTDGMMELVNVLIIDEIHLLNDERGLVLECLVARALMTGQKLQKPIRIVGLSATLPNYYDVANFIQAENQSTFYFDSSYRPTPLKCGFYGIQNVGSSDRANNIMNDIIFRNLLRILKMGKQAIIFVHKRAETYSTAMEIIDIIQSKNKRDMYLFECENSYKRKKEINDSKNEQIKKLFDFGMSVHHAGMLRKDRNLVESMFLKGDIKVLYSTATLAWGINLPAYAVFIKGTKMYDSANGEYKDIGVFDVQQIFGRAGRPQFDNEGEAIILTLAKQMDDYVKMMSNKQNIESHLQKGLDNCINAEIACGTISTITEGVQWLKKSYFYQRLIRNPLAYGIKQIEIQQDSTGHFVLLDMMTTSVQRLNRMQLIRYNEQNENVFSTGMGRVASNYYINVETMSYFMENLKPQIREQIFLLHLASASEFKQLDARKEEYEELKNLMNDAQFVEIDKSCFSDASQKVLILFEAYLRQKSLKAFSLISDMAYIVQNSARLLRAMFEIALNKNYANLAKIALRWVLILEKRLRPQDHPMKQFTESSHIGKLTNPNQKIVKFGYMKEDIAYTLTSKDIMLDDLYDGNYYDRVGSHQVQEIKQFLGYLPNLQLEVSYQPITRSILKIQLVIYAKFEWNDRWNGKSEPFWLFVDNDQEILHQEYFQLHKKDVTSQTKQKRIFKNETEYSMTFFIPYEVINDKALTYNLQIISDRWFGVSFYQEIDLSDIQIPEEDYPHTKLLRLKPLSINVFKNDKFTELFQSRFKFFNPIQTQVFHTLYNTDSNVLIGAPTGSGKTIMSEFAMLRVFKNTPNNKIIYIAPLKALAKERIVDWKKRLQEGSLKKIVEELTGDFTPDIKALLKADILITTPEKWDGISRNWQHRSYVQKVSLVIIDEIHLLGQERGPVIEVIVSRMRYISQQTGGNVRFIGLSTALANAKDVADWLGVHKLGLFNFKPSVRPVPIKVLFDGFAEKNYCPRMATMNKPAYRAIMTYSKNNPVLIFVSSRRQTRLTAFDLISMSVSELQSHGDDSFEKRPMLNMNAEEIHLISQQIHDENLQHTIQYGVGMHHAGLVESDRKIVEDLFVRKKIQVLVTTSTLAWGVNFPARLVIIKGTEFFDPKLKRYVDFPLTDLLQMMGRAGRPQFDETGYACVFVSEEKKNFYKKFLYEPFPVESSLGGKLVDHLNAEIASGTLLSKQNCIDYLTWTYFFRRLTKNPTFYKLKNTNEIGQKGQVSAESINLYLQNLIEDSLEKLVKAGCLQYSKDDGLVTPTTLGYLASFYYLSHETIKYLKDNLSSKLLIKDLIPILANAKEFFGLPVRHNEDILNEALSHLVPIKIVKNRDFENPHVKANLLIQAHLERCPLPCTDYVTDTKSVLDQSIRIIQGMIDIATHQGNATTTINLIHLIQMIIQGQWLEKSPFYNVSDYDKQHLLNIYNLPNLDIKFSVASVNERNEIQDGESLQEGGEGMVNINIKRLNKGKKQKVLISRFPKEKEASWFLLVINPVKDDIIALKRISFNRFATKNLVISLPQDFLDEKLELLVMCDSYIGIDYKFEIDLIKMNGLIEGKQINKDNENEIPYSKLSNKQAYCKYNELKDLIVDDTHSDNENITEIKKSDVIHQQIKKGIDSLLDSDNENDNIQQNQHNNNIDDDLDQEDDKEYDIDIEQMIEKDMDNWI